MLRQISCEHVRLGMYIHGFGGSWFDHPFWRGRFALKSPDDVERVRESGVPYVVIDTDLGDDCAIAPAPAALAAAPVPKPIRRRDPWSPVDCETPQAAERRRAVALVARSKKVVKYVFDGARLGRAVQLADVTQTVDAISQSVAASPQTFLGVAQLKNKDEYTYLHSVAVCALMVCVARHMGLPEEEVRELGLAGLLHDIGKMGVAEEILNKQGRLTDAEFAAVKAHPEHGFAMLSKVENIPPVALDVCHHHHEKMDGRGYPFALPADRITLAARLGAVCDVYDALTSDRAYKAAWTPQQAIGAMWSWEGHFDREVMLSFMQAVGIYPVGLLVRLRSNRLGIVLEKKRRNARPRAMAFYDTRAREMMEPEEVVLGAELSSDQAVSAEQPEAWGIGDFEALRARWTEMAA